MGTLHHPNFCSWERRGEIREIGNPVNQPIQIFQRLVVPSEEWFFLSLKNRDMRIKRIPSFLRVSLFLTSFQKVLLVCSNQQPRVLGIQTSPHGSRMPRYPIIRMSCIWVENVTTMGMAEELRWMKGEEAGAIWTTDPVMSKLPLQCKLPSK